jgi:hypothetical protein
MSPSAIKTFMQSMNDMYFAMEAENRALRELLRRQGLSDVVIRRRVGVYLKEEDYRKFALQRMHELCEETLKHLPSLSLEEALAEMPIKGPLH